VTRKNGKVLEGELGSSSLAFKSRKKKKVMLKMRGGAEQQTQQTGGVENLTANPAFVKPKLLRGALASGVNGRETLATFW